MLGGWWEEASKEEDGDEASTVDDIKALQKGKMDCRVIETKVPVLVAQDHSLVRMLLAQIPIVLTMIAAVVLRSRSYLLVDRRIVRDS